MNQAVEVCVEAEVEFGAVGKEEITGEAPAGVKEEEEDSEVKEEVKEEKLCVDSPSPFARGPPSSEGSTEGWGWKTRSLSDGKIPSITDSDLHEDAAGEDVERGGDWELGVDVFVRRGGVVLESNAEFVIEK